MDYRSARDLPSVVEAAQQLEAFRLLRYAIPAARRPDIAKMRRDLYHIADTVDGFYELLGPRNWIYHDNDPERLFHLTIGLNRLPAMRKRLALVEKAKADYFAGRYYSTVHVLLSVMDGFVNEFETVRKGLHARQAEELKAWDSVVGHHMGLARAHRTFTKGRSATTEEPVYELYRNGIVHGSILNYDNIVVATKAWNRLMAVADWARAREKEQQPAPAKPTWRELFARIAEQGRTSRAVTAFEPFQLGPRDDGFATHPVHTATAGFLTAWTARNFGAMAALVTADVHTKYGNAAPRQVRLAFADHGLSAFTIRGLDFRAAAACTVAVDLTAPDGAARSTSLRWIREDETGQPVPVPLDGGTWRLYTWHPAAFPSGKESPA
ncbi:hypothetical protein ABZW10_31420 [Kitasatospora sp. NPDC004723]|uniref:hypothetical protein n=1 Tax=Kitasatospora sp. NPDC004723 TaxID=3154288 RepID=UPI0033A14620